MAHCACFRLWRALGLRLNLSVAPYTRLSSGPFLAGIPAETKDPWPGRKVSSSA